MIFPASLPEPSDRPETAESEAPVPAPQRQPGAIPPAVTAVGVLVALLILLWAVIGAAIREPAPRYATIAAPNAYGCRDAAVLSRILELLGADNDPERKRLVDSYCEHFPVGARIKIDFWPSRGPVSGYPYFSRQKYWFHRSAFYSAQ